MSAAAALWDRLATQGFVAGTLPTGDGERAPWYVTAMVGTAAWIAALFLLVFIGSLTYALVHTLDAPLPIGVAICVPAVVLLQMRASGLFLRQLAVAMSLAGQALVVFGLTDHHLRDPLAWLAVALFEAALVAASRETVHRALAALACLVALRVAALTAGAPWLVAPALLAGVLALHLAETRWPVREALWSPLWAALGLSVLMLVPFTFVDSIFWYGDRIAPSVLLTRSGNGLVGLLWLAVVGAVAARSGIAMRSRAGALTAIVALAVAACAWRIPMLVVSLALLLVAFASGRRVLAGLAVLAVLGALAQAYYSLQWTLLAKSAALAATGAVLLLASAAARFLAQGEDDDA
ncbi:MAG: DUF4401 domain-containing protein [Burkholderiales bacterium]